MEERYYLITVTVASGGGENRVMTPYDDKDTALRKFLTRSAQVRST